MHSSTATNLELPALLAPRAEAALAHAREAAYALLITLFGGTTTTLEMVAERDRALLAAASRRLRRSDAATGSRSLLAAPADFRLDHSELGGVIVAKARRLVCAGSYEAQITTGDPGVEAGWKTAGTFSNCAHIDLSGLTRGKTYSVRLRGIGAHGPGAWTPAASLAAM